MVMDDNRALVYGWQNRVIVTVYYRYAMYRSLRIHAGSTVSGYAVYRSPRIHAGSTVSGCAMNGTARIHAGSAVNVRVTGRAGLVNMRAHLLMM